MNLENEILQLCFDVLEKEMTPLEAQKEILRLFSVVEQSEQLCTKCGSDNIEPSDKDNDIGDEIGHTYDFKYEILKQNKDEDNNI